MLPHSLAGDLQAKTLPLQSAEGTCGLEQVGIPREEAELLGLLLGTPVPSLIHHLPGLPPPTPSSVDKALTGSRVEAVGPGLSGREFGLQEVIRGTHGRQGAGGGPTRGVRVLGRPCNRGDGGEGGQGTSK